MPLLDKLKFWKKDQDDFGQDPFADLQSPLQAGEAGTSGGTGFDHTGLPINDRAGLQPAMDFTMSPTEQEMPSFGMSPPSSGQERSSFTTKKLGNEESFTGSPQATTLDKDIALLSSKLDTIKIMLEHLNHRMENIERVAHATEQEQPLRRRGSW